MLIVNVIDGHLEQGLFILINIILIFFCHRFIIIKSDGVFEMPNMLDVNHNL